MIEDEEGVWRPIAEAPRTGKVLRVRQLMNRPFHARWDGMRWAPVEIHFVGQEPTLWWDPEA